MDVRRVYDLYILIYTNLKIKENLEKCLLCFIIISYWFLVILRKLTSQTKCQFSVPHKVKANILVRDCKKKVSYSIFGIVLNLCANFTKLVHEKLCSEFYQVPLDVLGINLYLFSQKPGADLGFSVGGPHMILPKFHFIMYVRMCDLLTRVRFLAPEQITIQITCNLNV